MARPSAEHRRFRRLPVALRVHVRSKSYDHELISANVSRHGIFLRTDNPMPDRQLVRMNFQLPGGIAMEVVGMVAHRFRAGEPSPCGPGMGIDFFSVGKDAKKLWDRFCLELERLPDGGDEPLGDTWLEGSIAGRMADLQQQVSGSTSAQPRAAAPLVPPVPSSTVVGATRSDTAPRVAPASAPPTAPVRRQHPRFVASFLLRLRDKSALQGFFSRDIGMGGTFLRTPLLKQEGDILELVLVHPETDQEFSLSAQVVRVVRGPDEGAMGMGLEFFPLTDEYRDRLRYFIDSGVAYLGALADLEAETVAGFDAAMELDADSPRVHAELGRQLLVDQEDAIGAVVELEKALLLDPLCAMAHEHLPLAYALLGDKGRALQHLRIWRRLQAGDGH